MSTKAALKTTRKKSKKVDPQKVAESLQFSISSSIAEIALVEYNPKYEELNNKLAMLEEAKKKLYNDKGELKAVDIALEKHAARVKDIYKKHGYDAEKVKEINKAKKNGKLNTTHYSFKDGPTYDVTKDNQGKVVSITKSGWDYEKQQSYSKEVSLGYTSQKTLDNIARYIEISTDGQTLTNGQIVLKTPSKGYQDSRDYLNVAGDEFNKAYSYAKETRKSVRADLKSSGDKLEAEIDTATSYARSIETQIKTTNEEIKSLPPMTKEEGEKARVQKAALDRHMMLQGRN